MRIVGDPRGLIKSPRHLQDNEELSLSAGRTNDLHYPESMIRIRYDATRQEFVIGKSNDDGEFIELLRIPGD